jgi:Ras-related protein Rab-11A
VDFEDFDCLFKIVLIGKSFVGKSKVLRRYQENAFVAESEPTVGVEFATKMVSVEGSRVKVQIWDTFGSEKFKALSKVYFRGAVGAVLVYDITNEESFLELPEWLKELEENVSRNEIVVMLAGNKADLEEDREVRTELGLEFAEKNGMAFFETSAKEGKNVDLMFSRLVEEIFRQMRKASLVECVKPSNSVLVPDKPQKKKKKKCDC